MCCHSGREQLLSQVKGRVEQAPLTLFRFGKVPSKRAGLQNTHHWGATIFARDQIILNYLLHHPTSEIKAEGV